MIAAQRAGVPQGKFLGMGTICNVDQTRRAIDAGAMFLVTPNFDREVIAYATAKNIPVVALTSYAMHGDMDKAKQAGCVGYITKPIDTRNFAKVLAQYVAGKTI